MYIVPSSNILDVVGSYQPPWEITGWQTPNPPQFHMLLTCRVLQCGKKKWRNKPDETQGFLRNNVSFNWRRFTIMGVKQRVIDSVLEKLNHLLKYPLTDRYTFLASM